MQEPIEDRNLVDLQPLVSPRALRERLPRSERATACVASARSAIRDVIHGRDARRAVVVVGPCSIHDPAAALDYARRLADRAHALRDDLVVVMRTYFEKPRTTVGWKGLVNDPHLDGTCDVPAGLEQARALLLEINELGLPCGSEVLDPFTPQFIADLLAWASIGARTAESQTHRQLASGLSMPVGFKNATDGGVEAAHNALLAAGHAHSFLGITADGEAAVVRTRGNPDCHVVLRGGRGHSNFDADSVAAAAALVGDSPARSVMVDCSHDNSGKDPERQALVCRDVASQLRAGGRALMGVLLESNLEGGQQPWKPGGPLRYGVSITDACLDWDATETLLQLLAESVRRGAEAPSRAGKRGPTPGVRTQPAAVQNR